MDYLSATSKSAKCKAGENSQGTSRTKRRAAAKALQIAKNRVDNFALAELVYTGDYLRFYAEASAVKSRSPNYHPPYEFKPLLFCAYVMADIGRAMIRDVKTVADPICRAEMKQRFQNELSRLRRPFYYARETERRRLLAQQRRKIKRRHTTAPEPSPQDILAAWNVRKTSKKAMIRLGGLLVDLSCYVDSALRIDEYGNIIGRNGGIRGWLAENLPELHCKYKTLMRYKEMAEKLRQATDTHDPKPTSALLKPAHPVVKEILSDEDNTFVSILRILAQYLDSDKTSYPPRKKPPPN